MGWKIWQQGEKKQWSFPTALKEPFHLLTITLLSLLLPLSFLLLARLTTARYLFAFKANPTSLPPSLIFSFFLYTNPTLLHVLVSLVCVAALLQGLTGQVKLSSESPEPVLRPRLYTAWIFLCTLQVCVGLGIEGSIDAGVDGFGFGYERNLLSRVIFFLGLHETMLYWSRTIVKPVVDDSVYGFATEERWVERVAMATSFGSLWWWGLRDEVESLVVVAETKKELLTGVDVADFVGWWLYYLTVTVGMVRVVKGLIWFGVILLCKTRRIEGNADDYRGNEEKV
ncbi:hypothetical protein RJ639_033575 [Escallonia herrerae]|uniref:Transmembrane protein n=1 Tax=Escallonia herrerae TaxID=1293975 RepID=A0AA89BAJ9_9ASTE|nr:hypothetical protein RJ639_033575 [Escallonia herrerae]